MARGRMLNQSYAEDKLLAELFDEAGGDAVAIYFGLIPFQDREGRIHGDPFVLKGRCWPRARRITPEAIEAALRACNEKQLLIWYEVGGDRFVCFPNFRKNQPKAHLDREAESALPPPPPELLERWRKPRERVLTGPGPDLLRTNSGPAPEQVRRTPAEWKRREEKGREENVALETKSGVLSREEILNLGSTLFDWKQPRGGPAELELNAVCPMTREEFDAAAEETRRKAAKPGFGYLASVVASSRKARAGPAGVTGYHPGSTKFGDGDVKL